MTDLYNKLAQIFYRLAYQVIQLWFFVARPTVAGVYVAVWHEEKLLVIKNSYKKSITIPCGRIKRGEDSVRAAVRELKEEVGIQLDPRHLTFVGEYTGKFRYAIDVGSFYEIETTKKPLVQPDNREVVWAKFMSLEQIGKLNLNPTVKNWLDDR